MISAFVFEKMLAMRAKQFSLLILVVLLVASGVSCVPCKHPLSDEKTSKLDERLIGEWRLYDGDKPAADANPVFVGRVAGRDNTLEVVQCDVDKDGHVVVERSPLYATEVDSLRLVSMRRQGVKEDGESVYDVVLYEMPDKDTLNLYLMDDQVMGASIQKMDLPGTVKARNSLGATHYSMVNITASAEELRKFIEKTGKKCFSSEFTMTMKRVPANR
jgi:hypothetical protein